MALTKKLITKRELVSRIMTATGRPAGEAELAFTETIRGFAAYLNDPEVNAAVSAHLRVHGAPAATE